MVDENITLGWDKNPPEVAHTPEKKGAKCWKQREDGHDRPRLMIGNPKLAEMGYVEESCGHNAIAAGFQGQRQWTDHMPNGDFMVHPQFQL